MAIPREVVLPWDMLAASYKLPVDLPFNVILLFNHILGNLEPQSTPQFIVVFRFICIRLGELEITLLQSEIHTAFVETHFGIDVHTRLDPVALFAYAEGVIEIVVGRLLQIVRTTQVRQERAVVQVVARRQKVDQEVMYRGVGVSTLDDRRQVPRRLNSGQSIGTWLLIDEQSRDEPPWIQRMLTQPCVDGFTRSVSHQYRREPIVEFEILLRKISIISHGRERTHLSAEHVDRLEPVFLGDPMIDHDTVILQ